MGQIEITEKAKIELNKIIEQNTKKFLRLFLNGIGWNGPRIGLALDEPKDNDIKVTSNNINIVYDKKEEIDLGNCVIDFESSFFGKEFTVRKSGTSCC